MEIGFFGAIGRVTGSKYLVCEGEERVLVDCGLFQGFKQLRRRNREPFPVAPKSIGGLILTHAHIDHSGYIPLLVKNGFAGKVYCTAGTPDLCEILLADSGYLQEEEAEYANPAGLFPPSSRPSFVYATRRGTVLAPVRGTFLWAGVAHRY
jgi:metallo-beta-lactamase family protein